MKCAEGFKKYYNKLEKEFHHLLVEVLEQNRETTVYELRANLEKQQAFFRLLAALDPGFSPALAFDAFGKIYPKAGKVLDLQLAGRMLSVLEADEGPERVLSARLEKRAKKALDKFREYTVRFSLLPVKRLSSLVRSRLSFLPEEGLRERFLAYFRELFQLWRGAMLVEGTGRDDFDVLQEKTNELHLNLLLILQLCSHPQDLSDGQAARLENLRGLLAGRREVTQTLALGATARKEWPEAFIQRLHKEEVVRTAQVRVFIDQMGDDLAILEDRLLAFLSNEPLEGGKPVKKVEEKGKQGAQHSFGQINVDEGIK